MFYVGLQCSLLKRTTGHVNSLLKDVVKVNGNSRHVSASRETNKSYQRYKTAAVYLLSIELSSSLPGDSLLLTHLVVVVVVVVVVIVVMLVVAA